jgi:hypothetical protein
MVVFRVQKTSSLSVCEEKAIQMIGKMLKSVVQILTRLIDFALKSKFVTFCECEGLW